MDVWNLFADPEPVVPQDYAVLRVHHWAMATDFEVLLPFGDPAGQFAAEDALGEIDGLEEQMSVFRPMSEVSRLNATAFAEPVVVERRLFDLLHQATHLSHETHGAFDIATGALTKAWGFYQRQGRVPTPAERSAAMAKTGSRFLAFDVAGHTVRYLRKGLEINLGGIGKGYALDRAADVLTRERGIRCALLHGGMSSARAVGSLLPDGRGWPVRVKHPWLAGVHLGTVWLAGRAMGTSSATFQHFEYNGQKLGHVLDPRSGWPATGVAQVSVIAPTAAEADALSTAFFVLGPAAAEKWCRSRPDVGVLMLPDGEEAVRAWNLPRGLFEPSPRPDGP